MYRSRRAAVTLLGLLVLAGCSQGAPAPDGTSGAPSRTAAAGSAAAADQSCTGGLKGTEPGVVRITCDGTATIRVQAGGTSKDFHGGVCHSAGDVWSAAAGVVIDATGVHGTYTGPPVDSVAVNNTATGGKGTIQLVLGGKHYFDLGNATITLAAGGTGARLEGTSEKLSDAPGAKITVDVTC
jgi:hypothetical protein